MPTPWLLGIDPGVSGVVAIFDIDGRRLWLHSLPYLKVKRGRAKPRNELQEGEVAELLRWLVAASNGNLLAAIEEQSPAGMMPVSTEGGKRFGGSPSSMYQQLGGYFMVRGIMTGVGIAYTSLPPGTWKKELKLSSDKADSRDLAIRLMPLCVKSFAAGSARADFAEAALIAVYMAKVNNIVIPSNIHLVPIDRQKKAA